MVDKNIFHLVGMPRAGNTVLGGIINQNPDLQVSPLSPLSRTVSTLHQSFEGESWENFDWSAEQDNLEPFGRLAHKIKGYNVKAWGNEESHSLENVIPAVDNFPTDIIFRQRRQYLKINQYTLEYYDNLKSTQ